MCAEKTKRSSPWGAPAHAGTPTQAIGCCGIGDEGVVSLAEGCSRLARLDVRGCMRVTEVSDR